MRRMSRQFACVGVVVPSERLRQIAAGRPASEAELFDIAFAEVAIRIQGDRRHDNRARLQRRFVHTGVVAGAIVLALATLLCLGLAFFMLAAHTSPF